MSRLCAVVETCYERAMKSMPLTFYVALLFVVLITLSANAQVTKTNAEKAKDAMRNAADKTGETVKDTTHKAIESGKAGAQKAGEWATNVAGKATKLGTNVAAKAKEGAQKVENEATNIIGEIKEKVSH